MLKFNAWFCTSISEDARATALRMVPPLSMVPRCCRGYPLPKAQLPGRRRHHRCRASLRGERCVTTPLQAHPLRLEVRSHRAIRPELARRSQLSHHPVLAVQSSALHFVSVRDLFSDAIWKLVTASEGSKVAFTLLHVQNPFVDPKCHVILFPQ